MMPVAQIHSGSSPFNFGAEILYLRWREQKLVAKGFLIAAITSGAMGLALILWLHASSGYHVWLVGLGGILFGGLTYSLCLIALRVPEVRALLLYIQKRISGSQG